jgi:PAS domain S-box-containing protein
MSVAQQGAVERRLPPQPSSVREARRMVRDLLAGADRDDLAETAVLLVSEIVTNALLHAGTPIDVSATVDDRGLRVEVGDGSLHLPTRRRYGPTAGTGRGMLMLERLVDDWGVARRRDGKTVWFELSSAEMARGAGPVHGTTDGGASRGPTVAVRFENMPLLLHVAWQEHAQTLLREYLLARLDTDEDVDPIQTHAEATDAIAVLGEHVPRPRIGMRPSEVMADATEPLVSAPVVDVPVPLDSVRNFQVLNEAIEAAIRLSGEGLVLTPQPQPEVQEFRKWLCRQVAVQAGGGAAAGWSVRETLPPGPATALEWDAASVNEADRPVIAADQANRILAVSPAMLELLGYDDAGELVDRRLVAVIPPRYRQAHVAGFTLHLLVGRRPLLDHSVLVPALRRDGSEVQVEMTVRAESAGEGRQVYVAVMEPVAEGR